MLVEQVFAQERWDGVDRFEFDLLLRNPRTGDFEQGLHVGSGITRQRNRPAGETQAA
ncbi:MAG: hypothetical protein ACKVT0_19620 [Planctomycetaceae bacterium]